LQYLGIDPDVAVTQKSLTEQDHLTAARNSIFETQPVSRTDVPHSWRSPSGKVASQYKQFAHKHARFIKKYVMDEALKGNIWPLLWMAVLSQAFGEPLRLLKGLVRGKMKKTLVASLIDKDDTLLDTLTIMGENMIQIGGLGLVTEGTEAITGYRPVEGILKSVVGPTISDIASYAVATAMDIYTAVGDKEFTPIGSVSKKGQSQIKTAKSVVRAIPFVGPLASEYIFPSNESIFGGNNRGTVYDR
jgi:hypothetical protein